MPCDLSTNCITLTIVASSKQHLICCDSLSDELYKKYSFLEKLLSRDFIFQPGHTQQVSDVSE